MRAASLGLFVALVSASACGGSTQSDGTSTGGTSTGGTSTGGTSTGGTSTGGTSTGGTSMGGTSTGGTSMGGTSATGGSGNVSSFTACEAPGTCELFATNCCGGYCDPNAPLSGFQAVNQKKLTELQGQLCQGDIACPGCVSFDNPNYLALCRAGSCTAVDLRLDSLSACKTNEDCRVRWGSSCCEDCGGADTNQLIAYNKNANLEAEVCGPFGGACPPCMPPPYPSYVLPLCSAEGHCYFTVIGP